MLSRVFADYPARFVREIAEELPRTSKWLPQVAEVEAALKAKVDHRNKIKYRAMWMQREHDRREREAEREARLAAIPAARREEIAAMALTVFAENRLPQTSASDLTDIPPEMEAALRRLGWEKVRPADAAAV